MLSGDPLRSPLRLLAGVSKSRVVEERRMTSRMSVRNEAVDAGRPIDCCGHRQTGHAQVRASRGFAISNITAHFEGVSPPACAVEIRTSQRQEIMIPQKCVHCRVAEMVDVSGRCTNSGHGTAGWRSVHPDSWRPQAFASSHRLLWVGSSCSRSCWAGGVEGLASLYPIWVPSCSDKALERLEQVAVKETLGQDQGHCAGAHLRAQRRTYSRRAR